MITSLAGSSLSASQHKREKEMSIDEKLHAELGWVAAQAPKERTARVIIEVPLRELKFQAQGDNDYPLVSWHDYEVEVCDEHYTLVSDAFTIGCRSKSMNDNPNESAFPVTEPSIPGLPMFGLTKREHFAGLAMQGILASEPNDTVTNEMLAGFSVQLADALLAELGKTNGV